MNKGIQSVLKIASIILYVILLPWPLYVALPYMIFTGWMVPAEILTTFAIELTLGVTLVISFIKRFKDNKKLGFRIGFFLLLISFAIYSVTAVIYLFQVLMSVI